LPRTGLVGEGFTDWVNVRRARPHLRAFAAARAAGGHYYDQSRKERWSGRSTSPAPRARGLLPLPLLVRRQALLETPTNLVLENRDLDFPFCLAWANETWSRRWDGRDHHVLQAQTHRPIPRLEAPFDYLFRAWSDPARSPSTAGRFSSSIARNSSRAWARCSTSGARRRVAAAFRALPRRDEAVRVPVPEVLRHFDATVQFQPFEALFSPDFEGKVSRPASR
jgi:hypothetical protein